MQKVEIYITKVRPYLMSLGLLLLIVGMLISKAMLSIGMMILIGLWLINPEFKTDVRIFLKDGSLILLTCLFFLYLFSGIYSEDTPYFLERIRIKLPFLFMPFAFVSLRILPRNLLISFLSFYIIAVSATAGYILFNYFINYDQITESILIGKAIPGPVNHIRFSLMTVIAIFSAGYIYLNKEFRNRYLRNIHLLLAILLIAFLHIYAVRSGIFAFYIVAAIMAVRMLFVIRRKWIAITLLAMVITAPVVAFYAIIPFQNKINYMKYDLQQFMQGNIYEGLSDSRRLASIQAGFDVAAEDPLIGVGIGDVLDKLNERYTNTYTFIPQNVIIHNQYIFILAGIGIVGVMVSLVIFMAPLVYHDRWKNWYYLSVNLVLLFSFMVEATLETQLGTAIYIFFILYPLTFMDKKHGQQIPAKVAENKEEITENY